jgi:hypothetical protein
MSDNRLTLEEIKTFVDILEKEKTIILKENNTDYILFKNKIKHIGFTDTVIQFNYGSKNNVGLYNYVIKNYLKSRETEQKNKELEEMKLKFSLAHKKDYDKFKNNITRGIEYIRLRNNILTRYNSVLALNQNILTRFT